MGGKARPNVAAKAEASSTSLGNLRVLDTWQEILLVISVRWSPGRGDQEAEH